MSSRRSAALLSLIMAIACAAFPSSTFAAGPAGVESGLEFWFSADSGTKDSGGNAAADSEQVETWEDQSTNSRDATRSAGSALYSENGLNFNPADPFVARQGRKALPYCMRLRASTKCGADVLGNSVDCTPRKSLFIHEQILHQLCTRPLQESQISETIEVLANSIPLYGYHGLSRTDLGANHACCRTRHLYEP